ncbi:MAG: glutamate synthase central domain-containing protein, partial [Sedimentisphaerales bacterium]|nr:glutamate synthase central domain-containing protein [Sedimentisphaerales bacterium]
MTQRSRSTQGVYEQQYDHDGCGIGAVINISGQSDHDTIQRGRQILLNLRHRGAASGDDITGDGAGILIQVPHEFFTFISQEEGRILPNPGCYGVGMLFEPKDEVIAQACRALLAGAIRHYGMKALGWRKVPTNPSCLGPIALAAEPAVCQVFVDGCGLADLPLQRRLFLACKRAERSVHQELGPKAEDFYIVSLSNRTICYKGMFMDQQLFEYYPDLLDQRVSSAFAIVHQRYSTNTLPNWWLAQPFRCIAHNGEINTLSGNCNSMKARQPKLVCKDLTEDPTELMPVIEEQASDSAAFDNVLELLVMAGRSMPHALMMIPEAFGPKYHISADKRAFYEYHAAIMEPWDGPAAILFTDGQLVGGTLDRNGLRPCRYTVTVDGQVIMASEAGVIEIPAEQIRESGRLRPGHFSLVDTLEGRIISDNEIKSKISRQKPYRRWLQENRIELPGLFDTPRLPAADHQTVMQRMRAFGYTREELRVILRPMAIQGQEPVGSMGNDTPLAVLSERPRLLFDYFKQLFAQVTNPAIDPLREGLVMSLMLFTGKKGNLLDETPQHCRQLKLPHPILTNNDLECLRSVRRDDFKVVTLDSLFRADSSDPAAALERALDELVDSAAKAVREGACVLILSDRKMGPDKAPIPSLLATSAVHHGLIRLGLRTDTGIIVESGEPREVMHFCLLCGFGANAINPYLALEAIYDLYHSGQLPLEPERLADNYIAAIKKGILKVMSKMGISTIRSYLYAQLFEAVGLNKDLIDRYFAGTTSRIGGIGLAEIAKETIARHKAAFCNGPSELDVGGQYAYRKDGELHLWNPQTVSRLQHAVRNNDPQAYAEFAQAINEQSRRLYTLRGLF